MSTKCAHPDCQCKRPDARKLLEETRRVLLSRPMTEEQNALYLEICAQLDSLERPECFKCGDLAVHHYRGKDLCGPHLDHETGHQPPGDCL